MILKQLIRYTNADALEATWVETITLPQQEIEPGVFDQALRTQEIVVKCHAYSNHPEQMAQLRTDLGADAAEYEDLIAEVEATYVPPEPVAPAPFKLSSLDYLDLFTESEQLAVASAAMTNVQAKLWYDRTLAAEYITLADPRTEAGLDALVQMELLTPDRKEEIVSAMVM